MKILKRTIYIITGLLLITSSIGFFLHYYRVFHYSWFLENLTVYTTVMDLLTVVIFLFLGVAYTYFGFKIQNINKFISASLLVFILLYLCAWILYFGFNCFVYLFAGASCPVYYEVARYIANICMIAGPTIATVLILISFIRNKKIHKSDSY